MNTGHVSFVAIQGRQGKHLYYLIQCPLRLIPRLFLFNEAEVPSSLRKTRSLDTVKIADITAYLSTQSENYMLAPLIAVCSSEIVFEPLTDRQPEIGRVHIPLSAQLIIHDGQHRRAAIQQFLSTNTNLNNDTIPLMLFPDPGLTRSPRLFVDLNRVQVRGSRSKRVLLESSDLAALVRQLIDSVPLFQHRVELEKTTISNRSTALFTLSAVYQANQALLGIHKSEAVEPEFAGIAREFWEELGEVIPEWRQIIRQEVNAAYLREQYVHSHTVTLIAIAQAGHALIMRYPDNWRDRLRRLATIDWSRANTALWEGRAMVRGKMSKAHDSIALSTITIKRALGLELAEKEVKLERRLTGS